jgi:predicted N-formylglutamate amidohydrolase
MGSKAWTLVLSCEHGGNDIPFRWRKYLSAEDEKLLPTHRGWDIGALLVAQVLEKSLQCPLFFSTKSRLLIDLNRSLHHPKCLGPSYRGLEENLRQEIYATAYHPYREGVEAHLRLLKQRGHKIFHLSVHSFTPVLDREERNADLAMLYDPSRTLEKKMAQSLIEVFRVLRPDFVYRKNYPYRGISDGFTKTLRHIFPERSYMGLEVEINQKHLYSKKAALVIAHLLRESLQKVL